MFYENKLKSHTKKEKTIKFDFSELLSEKNEKNEINTEVCYNFCEKDGKLISGYGLRPLQMPTSTTDLATEKVLRVIGTEIKAMWSFAWYYENGNDLKYYIFYFNENNQICFDNLFFLRLVISKIETNFTTTPVGNSCRINGEDFMIFSSEDGDPYLYGDSINTYIEGGPHLVSLCTHNGRLYAITSTARRSLVYSDELDIMQWNDETTAHLDFSDERGNLTKVIAFNDYVYVFREFGLTKISTYATSGEFSISHIFQSSSYIYPGSIASDGENVYFMTTDGFYAFNGSSVKRINLKIFDKIDLANCNAICFESKYFLACKMNFADGKSVGCETGTYVNNAVFVFNIPSEKVDFIRGVDVKQLLALNNPYVSKVVMCFNGANKGKFGELLSQGQIFGSDSHKCWSSELSEFGLGCEVKRLESFHILTNASCKVTFESERESKSFELKPSVNVQRVKVGLNGRRFKVMIETDSSGAEISNFKVSVR